ncbi:MAG TPA: FAD-dependent oxidoreductase [Vicinamibacteria bacterium]
MSHDRRTFLGTLGAASAATLAHREASTREETVTGMTRKTYDVAVIGAGVFGAWTAWHLRQAGRSVLLMDKYGPASARASSGGESRIIRMSYGPDEIYTRFSQRSLTLWKALFARIARPDLFHETGVLWMAKADMASPLASLATLARLGIKHERVTEDELRKRYPQILVPEGGWATFEPESGVLMARRAVQAVVADAVKAGVDYATFDALPPAGSGTLGGLKTASGESVSAGAYVFACGPWLGKAVPRALEGRIFPTRQQIFFFGVPPGDRRFASPALPTWMDFDQEFYGMPDLESRGFKAADDGHGDPFDPDRGERLVTAEALAKVKAFVARRFPALKDAPVVETRVCQYENTSNGDFVIDRHPGFDNVWIAGGGSGHGFKHGPAVGEYTSERVLKGGATEPRFGLAGKETVQKRSVH